MRNFCYLPLFLMHIVCRTTSPMHFAPFIPVCNKGEARGKHPWSGDTCVFSSIFSSEGYSGLIMNSFSFPVQTAKVQQTPMYQYWWCTFFVIFPAFSFLTLSTWNVGSTSPSTVYQLGNWINSSTCQGPQVEIARSIQRLDQRVPQWPKNFAFLSQIPSPS